MVVGWLRRRWSPQRSARPSATAYLPPTPLSGGVISLQVHDEQERLQPDATVTVTDRFNRQVATGETDTYGSYLTMVPPGPHKVTVSAGGYKSKIERVEVGVNEHHSLGSVTIEPDDSLALPEPGLWTFDQAHTEVRFTAQHIGMSKIHGGFLNFDGQIRVQSPFEYSEVDVTIDAASITTGVPQRDEHLRSPDFLDVARHPTLQFSSERLVPVSGDRWKVRGALTLRDTTSPVELDTRYLGLRSWNGIRAACVCRTELRREDYSVNWQQTLAKGIAVVGPTIQIELDVQAVLQQ
ncbi:hypothetical protein GIY23_04075 [Allosaccharopolyspora coralli]|uniref:Lipid/polyisoprenoid-binding YceI-like domain-containing protein n=1 Tax=Allosaccharopolyspora coralli TaxID=2665642 RepID=A0A5Q3Q2Z5_9PSEU|nr:YceI family protein [Allosaccharopolyspora coralli]QGK68832.1 hypothetical protein GIY23_04075 [Allosaccharopolyspora coralli]